MKQYILSFFLLSFTLFCFSQKPVLSDDFSLEISERYKEIENQGEFNFSYNNDVVLFKKGKDHFTVKRFKLEGLEKSKQKDQIIEDKGRFETLLQMEDRALIFYTKTNQLFVQSVSLISPVVDAPKLLIDPKSRIADNFGFESTFRFDSRGLIHKYGIKKSFDGQKLLILCRREPLIDNDKKNEDRILTYVFSKSLQKEWSQEYTMPYTQNQMDNEDFAIDNQGKFYMTATVYDSDLGNDLEPTKDEYTYFTEVFSAPKGAATLTKTRLKAYKSRLQDAVLFATPDHTPFVLAFYRDRMVTMIDQGEGKSAKEQPNRESAGIVTFRLGNNGELAATQQYPFSPEKIDQLRSERQKRIKNGKQKSDDIGDFENLRFNHVFPEPDGSLTVLAEQRYVTEKMTPTSTGLKPVYTLHYRDVLAAKLKPDGSYAWFHKLPKYQLGFRGKRAMSYSYMEDANAYYLLYLDDFKNLKLPLDGFPYRLFDGKGGYLFIISYTIDKATGEAQKVPVVNTKDMKKVKMKHYQTDAISRVSDKQFVIEGTDGNKRDFLLKLTLEK